MLVLRNLIIVLGVFIFSISVNATTNIGAAKALNQTVANKIVILEDAGEKTNINSADVIALQKIKGFGKKKAQAVIEYRNKNGIFNSLEDLLKVKCRGLNKNWLDKMNKFLTV